MAATIHCLVRFLAALFLALPVLAVAALPPSPSSGRTITIRVAADAEFRALPDWETRIRDTVGAVSDSWQEQFGIAWRIHDIVDWDSRLTSPREAQDLLDVLEADVERAPAEVLVGFSGKRPRDGTVGAARAFGFAVAVASERSVEAMRQPEATEQWRQEVLSHELAHLFGAFHVDDTRSVMSGTGRTANMAFDALNAQVIMLMRDFDFANSPVSVAAVPSEVREQFTRIFNAGGNPRLFNPLAVAFSNLGVALRRDGDAAAAVAAHREALALEPQFAQGHSNLGVALDDLGRFDEAIAAYREAVRLAPGYAGAYENLGLTLLRTRRLDEAEKVFERLVSVHPRLASGHYYKGRVAHLQGRLDAAAEGYREAVRLDPSHARAHAHLGRIYLSQSQPAEALEHLTRAQRIAPNLPGLELELVRIQHMLEQFPGTGGTAAEVAAGAPPG